MKVLWLCNYSLSDTEEGSSGTWLGAMAHGLLDSGAVELGIIAPGPVKQFTRSDYRQVKQWLVPRKRPGRHGLPPAPVVQKIVAAVNEFSPELIHIWGTEGFWGLLSARGLFSYPSLLEIQGLKGEIAKVFYGGLTLREQLSCIGLKELLKHRTLHADQRDYARWGLREKEIIRTQRFVDVQSEWAIAHVKSINPCAQLLQVNLALRQPIYSDKGWQMPNVPTIFCVAGYTAPFKGIHTAVRSLAILKKQIPSARLRIAGAHQRSGIRQDGYIRWVNRMILRLGLADAVEWLGPLVADEIVAELKKAAVVVIPTFIENCCTAMQEAMAVGTPVVASYVGGIPDLARDEESCLFYPPGDETMCAWQLERVLTDKKLAMRLSQESRKIAAVRNDRERIVQRQLEIYRQVVEKPC